MKAKSALKESKRSVPVHLLFVGVLGIATFIWTNWFTILLLSISLFALIMDVVNVLYITQKAKKDPNYLESKIQ